MPTLIKKFSLTAITAAGLIAGAGLLALNQSSVPVEATVAAPAVTLASLPASAAGTYIADAVHSSVLFKTTHAGVANFYGRFNEMAGSFVLAENPAESTFEFTIQTASVDTNNNGRDDHLRNPDFFNVSQFPTSTFKSTGITPAAEGPHTLHGDLTLNGVTKPINAQLTFTGTGEFRNTPVAGFEAVYTIKRSDFGITTYLGPIGDEVTVTVAVEGRKQN